MKRLGRPNAKSATVVDLFCGVGGLSYGFKKEGFTIAAGIDIDEYCRFPYESNNAAPFLRKNVANLQGAEITALFAKSAPSILVGCAPCQPFSTYNQKNSDPKWRLLNSFSRIISEVKPDIVSMENVPRLTTFKGGAVFRSFVRNLIDSGYNVSYGVLYGPDYGLPQTRSRLVLLASLLGNICLPKPTHIGRHRTVKDAIGNLPLLSHGGADARDRLHTASKLSSLNQKRMAAATPGGSWRDWSANLVADCHQVPTGKGYSSVYGRMSWEAPAPTITTQFFGFGNGRFGHPEQNRALSLREGALLQGFPSSYEFVAPDERVQFKRVGRLIGNAVPINLSRAIAKSVRRHLQENQ